MYSNDSAFVFAFKPSVFIIPGGVFVPFVIPINSSIQVRLENGHQPSGNWGNKTVYSRPASRI